MGSGHSRRDGSRADIQHSTQRRRELGLLFPFGYTPGPGETAPHGRQEAVGGDYFRAMQIPLVAGRTFDERDGPESPPVVVIDQYLVKRYFATAIRSDARFAAVDRPVRSSRSSVWSERSTRSIWGSRSAKSGCTTPSHRRGGR